MYLDPLDVPSCDSLIGLSLLYRWVRRNRSDCENRNHAAACDVCALAGSRDGAASPRRAASHAAVRYSKTLRCCCFKVVTTVIMLSTKREPSALCVPKLPLRQSTPGRIALSAILLVGSTPSTCTKVHNASRRFRMSRHVPAVLGTPQRLPASKSRSISRRSGVMEERNVERFNVPSRTRCHQVNIWCACVSKASPISSEHPPRSRIASKSRRGICVKRDSAASGRYSERVKFTQEFIRSAEDRPIRWDYGPKVSSLLIRFVNTANRAFGAWRIEP